MNDRQTELKEHSAHIFEMGCMEQRVYLKNDADAVIEAKDAEIAEIKQRYNDMDIAHTVHIAKMNAKIEELEAAIEEKDCDYKTVKLWNENATKEREELYERITELEKQLESEKASRYAESVDAGMRERRLKRALWLARAERAHLKVLEYWPDYCHNAHCRIAEQKWDKVERKCRAMAEKFK